MFWTYHFRFRAEVQHKRRDFGICALSFRSSLLYHCSIKNFMLLKQNGIKGIFIMKSLRAFQSVFLKANFLC